MCSEPIMLKHTPSDGMSVRFFERQSNSWNQKNYFNKLILFFFKIGETMAVARAMKDLETSFLEKEKEFWTMVIADESKHATFAWACVRWAIKQYPELNWNKILDYQCSVANGQCAKFFF